MEINKTVCKSIREDIQSALDKVGKKYGVALPVGGIKYTTDSIRFGVKGLSIGEAGAKVSPNAALEVDFKKNFAGAKKGIGDTFTRGGSQFTIVGSKSSYSKYPIIATGARGGKYKFARDVIGL